MPPPMMPAEKLSTSISKPGLTLPSISLSNSLRMYAVSGPDDHRAEEHRHVGADDDADRRHRTDHGTALAVDQPAAGVADEDRQQTA